MKPCTDRCNPAKADDKVDGTQNDAENKHKPNVGFPATGGSVDGSPWVGVGASLNVWSGRVQFLAVIFQNLSRTEIYAEEVCHIKKQPTLENIN